MRLEKSATRGTGPGRREYKTVQFELEKYDEEQGIVSGYASVFGNVDDGGDGVDPGAFAVSIAECVGRVNLLALHNACWLPVGRPLVLKEDTKGLYFEAKISDTALGRDVKTLIRDGVLTEFSIGYDPIEFEFDATGIRHLRNQTAGIPHRVRRTAQPAAAMEKDQARLSRLAFGKTLVIPPKPYLIAARMDRFKLSV